MKIVALGGGTAGENSAVDRRIIELTGKDRPRFLFLPTASGDGGHYINALKRIYKRLGCVSDALCLVRAEYAPVPSGRISSVSARSGRWLRRIHIPPRRRRYTRNSC